MYLTPRLIVILISLKLFTNFVTCNDFHNISFTSTDASRYYETSTGNDTFEILDNAVEGKTEGTWQSWLAYFNATQTAMTAFGFLLNLLTFITFLKNGQMFSPVIRALLTHQAFIDMLACVIGILLLAIPPMQVCLTLSLHISPPSPCKKGFFQ